MDNHVLEQFNQDGYLVIEDFLTPDECKELLIAGVSLTKDIPDVEHRVIFSTTDPEKQQHADNYFINSNDKIRYFFEKDALNPDGTLRVDANKSLNKVGHALHLLHPVFRKHTFSDTVKEICQQLELIDPAVVQSMYIYKNPGIGGEVVAHQDASYLFTEPIPPVGFWIALEDATLQNGCLWIAKGSHTSGVHRRLIRNPNEEDPQKLIYDGHLPHYDKDDFRAIPVRKGTCIVLHGLVVHMSAHNKSNKSRHAYTFHVIERLNNQYSNQNWLREGARAPFLPLYHTSPYMMK